MLPLIESLAVLLLLLPQARASQDCQPKPFDDIIDDSEAEAYVISMSEHPEEQLLAFTTKGFVIADLLTSQPALVPGFPKDKIEKFKQAVRATLVIGTKMRLRRKCIFKESLNLPFSAALGRGFILENRQAFRNRSRAKNGSDWSHVLHEYGEVIGLEEETNYRIASQLQYDSTVGPEFIVCSGAVRKATGQKSWIDYRFDRIRVPTADLTRMDPIKDSVSFRDFAPVPVDGSKPGEKAGWNLYMFQNHAFSGRRMDAYPATFIRLRWMETGYLDRQVRMKDEVRLVSGPEVAYAEIPMGDVSISFDAISLPWRGKRGEFLGWVSLVCARE